MKKILFVNNNMKIGGVQKSLYNLLWALDAHGGYDITLLLFSKTGAYLETLPEGIHVVECGGPFRYLGKSQGEYKHSRKDALMRGFLAAMARLLGRSAAIRLMRMGQPMHSDHYDYAVSFLHNGRRKAFYGGAQDYVLHCVDADRKMVFLHGDYQQCGASHTANNRMMERFDRIAACSDGCRRSLLTALPHLAHKCITVRNCHRYEELIQLAHVAPPAYDADAVHAVMVARLTHEKGVDRAITAVAHAIHEGVPVRLHIVGDGPQRQALQEQAAQQGIADAVHFHGEQTNPYPYIEQADLLLLTSYHEAAPMVIDEARCLGVPVLSTEIISAQEMIVEPQAGWVCANDQDALNEALCRVVKDREALQTAHRHLMERDVDNRLALEQFERLLI